jgi:acylphosphatase
MDAERSDRRTVRVRIKGSVQGVGYRYWTERVATGLDLTGWVLNRRDGSVEARSAAQDVAEMLERCGGVPEGARHGRHIVEEAARRLGFLISGDG